MRRIGIDLRCLPADGQPGAGVAHAARELSRALVTSLAPNIEWVVYLPHGALWDIEVGDATRMIRLSDGRGASLRRAYQETPCDILFVPSGAVAPGLRVRAIPWVHDVAIFDHPEWFSEGLIRRVLTTRLFRRGVTYAPRVLAVSQDTKDSLVSLFGCDPSIIDVTHEGGDSVLATLHGENLRKAKARAARRVRRRRST